MIGLYDMHSHLLPNVDDGAGSLEEALELLDMEYSQGVRGLLLTPHHRHGMFETDAKIVRDTFQAFSAEGKKRFPDLTLYLGWEYHACQEMKEELRSRAYNISNTEYVLIEFSAQHSRKQINNYLRDVISLDMTPIIAHVERCPQLIQDQSFMQSLRQSGVLFQVNADSLIGKEGFYIKRFCLKLLKEHWVDLIGSDAHDNTLRIPRLDACARYLSRKIGEDEMVRIMKDRPEEILKE